MVVIQEWWGLTEHIDDLVDRFAADGFVSLAPDLWIACSKRLRGVGGDGQVATPRNRPGQTVDVAACS